MIYAGKSIYGTELVDAWKYKNKYYSYLDAKWKEVISLKEALNNNCAMQYKII